MKTVIVGIVVGLIAVLVAVLINLITPPKRGWITKTGNLVLAIIVLVVASQIILYFATPAAINQPDSQAPQLSPSPPLLPPPSRTETSIPPLSTGPPVPDFTPATTPPLLPNERRYKLDFGDKTHVDLDSGLASKEGGPEYEVLLNFGRFFVADKYSTQTNTWHATKIVFIKDSDVSFSGCSRGTLIQGNVAHLSQVEQDETICVSTNRGAWAAMKIVNAKSRPSGLGAGDITFGVRLFRP